MKKILLITTPLLIIIVLFILFIIVNKQTIKCDPRTVPAPMLTYLTNKTFRTECKQSLECQTFITKETCNNQTACEWHSRWFDGMEEAEEFCISKSFIKATNSF